MAALRKIVHSDMGNAISIAKGSVKSTIPVSVSASINQLANNRKDTTEGVDITKRLVATELANAMSTLLPNASTTSKNDEQASKVVIDNQAVCTDIPSPWNTACAFTQIKQVGSVI